MWFMFCMCELYAVFVVSVLLGKLFLYIEKVYVWKCLRVEMFMCENTSAKVLIGDYKLKLFMR